MRVFKSHLELKINTQKMRQIFCYLNATSQMKVKNKIVKSRICRKASWNRLMIWSRP
jgi:hypothetical protein